MTHDLSVEEDWAGPGELDGNDGQERREQHEGGCRAQNVGQPFDDAVAESTAPMRRVKTGYQGRADGIHSSFPELTFSLHPDTLILLFETTVT